MVLAGMAAEKGRAGSAHGSEILVSEKGGSFPTMSDCTEIRVDYPNSLGSLDAKLPAGGQRPPASAVSAAADAGANRNVQLALAFTFLSSAGRCVWAFATLSVYLEQLTKGSGGWLDGGTVGVGVAEGVQGCVQCLIAPLAGWAADRYRRDLIMRVAGLVGFAAALVMSAALLLGTKVHPGGEGEWSWLSDHVRFAVITISLGVWGAYQGIWMTSLETIFADSIPTGQRSFYNMRKFVLMQLGNVTGPLAAIILYFAVGGDKASWSQDTVIWVYVGGIISCLPAMGMLFFFDDAHMRGRAAAAHTEAPKPAAKPEEQQPADGGGDAAPLRSFCGVTTSRIPHVVISSNLVNGLGAGMTIKFFPLFFAKEIGLAPIGVNAIYVGLPVLMVFAGRFAQRLSRQIGRIQVCLIYTLVGSAALAVLWAFGQWWPCGDGGQPDSGSSDGSCHWPVKRFWYVLLPIYLISTAPHMTFPLTQSVLMDYVPKQNRGKWNSLGSVTRFGWSGSAVIGGFVVDKWGYGPAFLVTAIMQCIAAALLALLLPLMTEERAVEPAAPAERAPLIAGAAGAGPPAAAGAAARAGRASRHSHVTHHSDGARSAYSVVESFVAGSVAADLAPGSAGSQDFPIFSACGPGFTVEEIRDDDGGEASAA